MDIRLDVQLVYMLIVNFIQGKILGRDASPIFMSNPILLKQVR